MILLKYKTTHIHRLIKSNSNEVQYYNNLPIKANIIGFNDKSLTWVELTIKNPSSRAFYWGDIDVKLENE